jgi:putative FmdB family regulatory protein
MPIYEYQALEACKAESPCSGLLEVFARMSDAALERCPTCGVLIQLQLSAPNTAIGGKHLLAEKNVAKNGFTQYRRAGDGVYEKTAGKGPQFISGD